jgi:hypothetical protein
MVDCLVPAGYVWLLLTTLPLDRALELGTDEGYEFMKAWLVSRGYPLYAEFWNDQPPLHTELLAFLFRLFGPLAYVGRLLTLAFTALLLAALYHLVRRYSGRMGGVIAVGLLVSSSSFVPLSAAAMIELPALSLALAAAWTWTLYLDSGRIRWLALSGALFGCALQIKLTAALYLPAFLLQWFLPLAGLGHKASAADDDSGRRPSAPEGGPGKAGTPMSERCWRDQLRRWKREGLAWGVGALSCFGLIIVMFYRPGAFAAIWRSHFSGATRVAADQYLFHWRALEPDFALMLSSVIGILVVCRRARVDGLFPVCLLATAWTIHSWHQPYWYYYVLHFSVPMAWLGGTGMVEGYRWLWRQSMPRSWVGWGCLEAGWAAWWTVLAAVLCLAPQQAWEQWDAARSTAPAAEDPNVVALTSEGDSTRWVFTDRVIYAFWAGRPVPPELAVIPAKRVWSGEITEADLVTHLKRYQPARILLIERWQDAPLLAQHLRQHYQPARDHSQGHLYLLRSDGGE